jgi:hypothetical protein
MSVYIITYQLQKPDEKKRLDFAIRQYQGMALSESSYAAVSEGGADEIYATLRSCLNPDDKLLVMRISEPYSGQAPHALLEWLNGTLG